MSVPRGKRFTGRASFARIAFQDSSEDVRSYYTLWQMLKGRSGAAKHLNSAGRGVYVLVAALWEAYCEDLALEAAHVLVRDAATPDDLPPELARRIARELRSDKHELSPWQLAGDGWRELCLLRVPKIARETFFNTPKPSQVDELFGRSIGLSNLSNCWTAPDGLGDVEVRDALRSFIELRGAIAHGAKPRPQVTKPMVSAFFQTVQHLVDQTDEAVAMFIVGKTGSHPWVSTAFHPKRGRPQYRPDPVGTGFESPPARAASPKGGR